MKTVMKLISFCCLGLTIIPSILVFKGVIEMKTNFILMAVAMFSWFVTAPFWMKSKSLDEEE